MSEGLRDGNLGGGAEVIVPQGKIKASAGSRENDMPTSRARVGEMLSVSVSRETNFSARIRATRARRSLASRIVR